MITYLMLGFQLFINTEDNLSKTAYVNLVSNHNLRLFKIQFRSKTN